MEDDNKAGHSLDINSSGEPLYIGHDENNSNHKLNVTLLGGSGRLYKYNTDVGFAPDVPLS